ncbi:unnamed protein product [Linum trigynum]|uniref:Putative plant transposon protein domain-containing protein n=1 Tax=Linum trigynum TaxID=586398 RepID=A0AAV2FA91_9ROSI
MAFNNAQLRPVVVFKNQGFRNAIVHSRYLRCFRDRPIYPSFTISPSAFSKYDMDVTSLVAGLGWESLTADQRFLHCPEAVRLFYVNIRRDSGPEPQSFTTMVYDHEITVTPALLASVLSLPHSGILASYESDFVEHGFDFLAALDQVTRDTGKAFPTRLSAGRLPDDLKVLHFFITRCFLPRDVTSAGLLHSDDLWILSNACARQPISYASLMFAHILKFGGGGYSGALPFGPLITRYLHRLGIDLWDKLAVCNIHDDLRPNHVLVRLDADVGRRKLVSGSGGDSTHCPIFSPADPISDSLLPALTQAAVTAIDGEVKRRKETGSGKTTSLLVCKERLELMDFDEARPAPDDFDPITPDSSSDDEISDYESPPGYPF